MTNPADTSTAEVGRIAVRAADAAEALVALPPGARAGMLRGMATALEDARDDLVVLAQSETHLPKARLHGELARTTGQLRLFADAVVAGEVFEPTIDPADPSSIPPRPDLRRMLQAIGPVAVFAASNFPFAFSVAGGDTASALAAGCPVVVKAHPGHPRLSAATGRVLAKAADRAGAPPGTIDVVHGIEAGTELVTHSAIRAAGFTGSPAGGRALFDLATGRDDPIPFHGELGSINPVVVTPGAAADRPDTIADGLVESFTLGVGQFCTKPGVVFVPSGSDLVQRVAGRVADEPQPMLNDRIASAFHSLADELAQHDAITIVAGSDDGESTGLAAPMVYVTSTGALLADPEAVFTERFGPVTILVRYDGLDDLKPALATAPGSLTVSLHGTEEEWPDLAGLVGEGARRAGRVVFDGWPTGVAVTHAMHHGGPWPATTSPLHTSVGTTAIRRWLRPIAWQDCPDILLPPALQDANPLGLLRRVDGKLSLDPVRR